MGRKRSIRASKERGAMLGTKYEAQQKVDVEPKLTGVSCGKWLQSLSSSFWTSDTIWNQCLSEVCRFCLRNRDFMYISVFGG